MSNITLIDSLLISNSYLTIMIMFVIITLLSLMKPKQPFHVLSTLSTTFPGGR